MWKGKGRSGIGDQTIIGEYDDWAGLSPNGRQWKNPHTMETRDLSGADYWHMRKAIEPKTWEDIPTHINGKACIANFSDENIQRWISPEQHSNGKKQIERTPHCVLPGQEDIERLDQQQLAMFERFKLGELSKAMYDSIISELRAKQEKAWDKHIETLTSSPLNGKQSEKEKTQEKLYMLATVVLMVIGWIAYHGIK